MACRVCGPNSENEWAREGRRIIPLLKRATAVTRLTEVANRAKLDIQSNNKILLPPLQTKTLFNPDTHGEVTGKGFVDNRYIKNELKSRNLHSPPPPLEDMMVKVSIINNYTEQILIFIIFF